MRTIISLSAIVLASSVALAQSFDAAIDTKQSTAAIDASLVLSTAGTLIGDYNIDTNPTGTQTRPGFFGGSGNNPIPVTVDLQTETNLNSAPAGAFAINIDFEALQFDIAGLTADILNGSPGTTSLSATLLYSTFNTINPTFIYPGGVPITLPLGDLGNVSNASLTQTDAAAGVLVETADPDVFTFAVALPAELALTVSFALPGSEPTETPIVLPIALPLTGQIERLEGGLICISIVLDPAPVETELPIEGLALPEIPLPLPTLGSATANVILALVADGLTFSISFGLDIKAFAEPVSCPADFNNDGNLDFFDIIGFLGAFAANDPAADFNNDTLFDFFDIIEFLGAFAAGCGNS